MVLGLPPVTIHQMNMTADVQNPNFRSQGEQEDRQQMRATAQLK